MPRITELRDVRCLRDMTVFSEVGGGRRAAMIVSVGAAPVEQVAEYPIVQACTRRSGANAEYRVGEQRPDPIL